MPVYYTPGVYFEKLDYGRGKISGVRTDIPGFVGIAEKGPLDMPVKLGSWKQFQSSFGSFIPQSFLAYAVYGFFENGGDTCYVVRIADTDKAKKAETTLLDKNTIQTIKITALNEGQWGNQIKVSLEETSTGSTSTADDLQEMEYSIVKNITGFEKGSMVKVLQNKNGIPINDYHYVKSVEPLSKKLNWDSPLKAAFNLSKPIYFSTMEFTLAFSLGGKIKETFKGLSISPKHSRYFAKPENRENKDEEVINGQSNLVKVEDLQSASAIPNNLPGPLGIGKKPLYLKGGVDGISSIDIYDLAGDPISGKKGGLRSLEDVDEVSMICIPDIMIQPGKVPPINEKPQPEPPDPCITKITAPEDKAPPYKPPKVNEPPPIFKLQDILIIQQRMIEHCGLLKDRIAIIDTPFGYDLSEVENWRRNFDSKYAALYYPWIRVDDPLRLGNQITRLIPPSGYIAGIYARSDYNWGVHKAPANEEVIGAKDVTVEIENHEQEILNPIGINCLRAFPGRGVMVWGARTLSSDKSWRFVNVRRLMMMIEESVEEAMQWAVFEPNDFNLRTGINISVSNFLEELWRKGALSGTVPEEAFFVRCDEVNNPQEVIDAGKIITDIGVAPSIPGEFIIFRIGKVVDRIKLVEEI
ncbi:MAG: phage tail sheath subtilisin-like domain-containing protein [Thermodesulfobacteriota bacterium]